MIHIGAKTFDTNIFLAPLSGCSDLSFRLICREHGAGFCFFEMLDSNSLVRSRSKNSRLLATCDADKPIGAQLLGADPSIMLDAARAIMQKREISILDINCACPAKKVIRKKAGAYLLDDVDTLFALLKKLASNLPIPVTVKLRIGNRVKNSERIVETARRCEANGAAALFVHGRTGLEQFAGEIDYGCIRTIKDAVNIPVFGAGNILTPTLAKKMFTETGCDGILVARGSLGNPWIFADIAEHMKTGMHRESVSLTTRKEVLKLHLAYIDKHKEARPSTKVGFMQKVAMWYLKGMPRATRVRERITSMKTHEALIQLIDGLREEETICISSTR